MPEPVMSQGEAQQFQFRRAGKDLLALLGVAAAAGGGARAGVGMVGNIRRNMRRKKERDEADNRKREIMFPATKYAFAPQPALPPTATTETLDKPTWYPPALALGAPLAAYAGWTGVSKLVKAHRAARERQELEKAKREFEDALVMERSTKFAQDLDELAHAYADGKIDKSMKKLARESGWWENMRNAGKGVGSLAIGAAGLSALLGAAGGWHLAGRNPEQAKIEAYREAVRRRRLQRPRSLMAFTEPPKKKKEEDDSDDKPKLRKSAWVGKLGKLGLGAAKKLALPALAVGTPWGRQGMAQVNKYMMKDPAYAESMIQNLTDNPVVQSHIKDTVAQTFRDPKTMQNITGSLGDYLQKNPNAIGQYMKNNPHIARQAYQQIIPSFAYQFSQQRPWMGSLLSRFLMPRKMYSSYRQLYG